jgi:uncharacterized protein YecE (DUF72 family)
MQRGEVLLGTSSWTAKGWESSFYPPGTQPKDFIRYYSTKFRTVEIDMTFYRIPGRAQVERWRAETPEGFVFAAKVPQEITHERRLKDCGDLVRQFVDAVEPLGQRLGPLLVQLPYFRPEEFPSLEAFLRRLESFFDAAPRSVRWAVEVRNPRWVEPRLLRFLRDRAVAFCIVDLSWMPPADRYAADPLAYRTADFAYLRWIGNRRAIEKITRTWDRVVVDRRADLRRWVPVVRALRDAGTTVYGYFNNHYTGHAPAGVALFEELLREESAPVRPY